MADDGHSEALACCQQSPPRRHSTSCVRTGAGIRAVLAETDINVSRKNVIGRVVGNTSVSRKILAAVGISVLGSVAVAGVGAVSLSSAADEAKAGYQESTLGLVHVAEMRTALVEVQLHQALSAIQTPGSDPREELGKA